MTTRFFIPLGAALAMLGVLAGTFGAHGLRESLPADLLVIFETGVRYHMFHALAIGIVGCLPAGAANRWSYAAGWLFLFGVLVFSGSLYALAISGERWLGMITPIGGACFILGWASLAIGAWRARRECH